MSIDKRKKEYFEVSKEFIDGFAKKVGAKSVAIYVLICRHKNIGFNTGVLELIENELGIGRKEARNHLELLEAYGVLSQTGSTCNECGTHHISIKLFI